MCRGLGAFQVYRLTPGARLTNADRVQTFHEAPRETLGTIAEQILFEHQWNPDPVAAPSGPTPAVHPVTDALRAVATHQRGGYVYAIDPYFDPHRAVPPYGIVGGWSVDNTGRLVAFSHNPNYRASPAALEFPTPLSALEVTMHLAITGYGSEADLFAAFRDAALSVFPPPGFATGPTHCDRPRRQSLHRGVHPSRPHAGNVAPVAPDHGSRARSRRSPGPAQPGASHQPDRPGGGTARLGRHEAYVPCRAAQHRQGGPALLTTRSRTDSLSVATSSGTRLFTYL